MKSNIPKGYRIASMEDYNNFRIVKDTIYYLTNGGGYQFRIRGRLIAGQRVSGITISETESEESYNDNYRKVIIHYIKSQILWIKE